MQVTQYQALAMRTAKMFPGFDMNMMHAALGIGSEIGELAETVNGIWMEVPQQAGAKPYAENIKEEVGDACWYAALGCAHMGWEFHELIVTDTAVVRTLNWPLWKAMQTWSPVAIHECAAGFAGELLTVVKAHVIYGKPLPEPHFRLTMGLYITALAALVESYQTYTFIQALEHNVEKLRKRYPEKYSDADALARADKAA